MLIWNVTCRLYVRNNSCKSNSSKGFSMTFHKRRHLASNGNSWRRQSTVKWLLDELKTMEVILCVHMGTSYHLASFFALCLPHGDYFREIHKMRMQAGVISLPKIPQEHRGWHRYPKPRDPIQVKPFQMSPKLCKICLETWHQAKTDVEPCYGLHCKNLLVYSWIMTARHLLHI